MSNIKADVVTRIVLSLGPPRAIPIMVGTGSVNVSMSLPVLFGNFSFRRELILR